MRRAVSAIAKVPGEGVCRAFFRSAETAAARCFETHTLARTQLDAGDNRTQFFPLRGAGILQQDGGPPRKTASRARCAMLVAVRPRRE